MKIYERQFSIRKFTDPSIPNLSYPLEMPVGDESRLYAIEWPMESVITKLIVLKSDAETPTPVTNFTVDLFNRVITAADTGTLEELAKIMPSVTTAIGSVAQVISSAGYVFYNLQGTETVQDRRIYLRITLDAAVPAGNSFYFDVAITGVSGGPR